MARGDGKDGERERSALALALDQARRDDGLSQEALAARLGTSQANVSKILAGRQQPHPRLLREIQSFIGPRWPYVAVGSDVWIQQVVRAATRSEPFRKLVASALQLMNENE